MKGKRSNTNLCVANHANDENVKDAMKCADLWTIEWTLWHFNVPKNVLFERLSFFLGKRKMGFLETSGQILRSFYIFDGIDMRKSSN